MYSFYLLLFHVVKIGDTPQRVTRVNPDSESWLRGDRPVTIEWDPKLINFTQVRIDILAYTEPIDPDTLEPDGPPTWEEIDEVIFTGIRCFSFIVSLFFKNKFPRLTKGRITGKCTENTQF